MAIENFNCNCCLFAQDLMALHLIDAQLGIPEEEKHNYIDCHYDLHDLLPDNKPEFNLKHCQSVGCGKWICGECGNPALHFDHTGCWTK